MAMLRGSNKHTFVSTDARPYETKFHWPFILIKDLNLSTSARLVQHPLIMFFPTLVTFSNSFIWLNAACRRILASFWFKGIFVNGLFRVTLAFCMCENVGVTEENADLSLWSISECKLLSWALGWRVVMIPADSLNWVWATERAWSTYCNINLNIYVCVCQKKVASKGKNEDVRENARIPAWSSFVQRAGGKSSTAIDCCWETMANPGSWHDPAPPTKPCPGAMHPPTPPMAGIPKLFIWFG